MAKDPLTAPVVLVTDDFRGAAVDDGPCWA